MTVDGVEKWQEWNQISGEEVDLGFQKRMLVVIIGDRMTMLVFMSALKLP